MDSQDYITETEERKKGQHLGAEERGAIKVLSQQGLGIRAIVREIGCAPSTVTNELRRGTPPRKSNRGKAPGYSPKLGEAVYRANRAVCRRPLKARSCKVFIVWVIKQVREHKWSLDSCMDTPESIDCTVRMRWSAPVRFTIWYGPVCFPSRPPNCRKP